MAAQHHKYTRGELKHLKVDELKQILDPHQIMPSNDRYILINAILKHPFIINDKHFFINSMMERIINLFEIDHKYVEQSRRETIYGYIKNLLTSIYNNDTQCTNVDIRDVEHVYGKPLSTGVHWRIIMILYILLRYNNTVVSLYIKNAIASDDYPYADSIATTSKNYCETLLMKLLSKNKTIRHITFENIKAIQYYINQTSVQQITFIGECLTNDEHIYSTPNIRYIENFTKSMADQPTLIIDIEQLHQPDDIVEQLFIIDEQIDEEFDEEFDEEQIGEEIAEDQIDGEGIDEHIDGEHIPYFYMINMDNTLSNPQLVWKTYVDNFLSQRNKNILARSLFDQLLNII